MFWCCDLKQNFGEKASSPVFYKVEVTSVPSREVFYLVCWVHVSGKCSSSLLGKNVPQARFLNPRLQVLSRFLDHEKGYPNGYPFVVEVTGLEPAASWSQMYIYSMYLVIIHNILWFLLCELMLFCAIFHTVSIQFFWRCGLLCGRKIPLPINKNAK